MHHWDSIAAVIQNDVLFSYVRKSFVAIGTVRSLVSVEPKNFANISARLRWKRKRSYLLPLPRRTRNISVRCRTKAYRYRGMKRTNLRRSLSHDTSCPRRITTTSSSPWKMYDVPAADTLYMALTDGERETLLNFIGFGNPKADTVFIGMEEGYEESAPLEVQLHERATFTPIMDLLAAAKAHPGKYLSGARPPIQRTWNTMIRVLLAVEGQTNPSTDDVRFYQRDRLGRTNESGALLELMPLPSPNANAWQYAELFPEFGTRAIYFAKMLERRLDLLRKNLAYGPSLVVAYGAGYWPYYRRLYASVDRFASKGPFEFADVGRTRVILTPHFTARTMNGRFEQLIAIATRKS